MTAEGPRLGDWMRMVRAPAALDLHPLTSTSPAEIAPEFARRSGAAARGQWALQSEYARPESKTRRFPSGAEVGESNLTLPVASSGPFRRGDACPPGADDPAIERPCALRN